MQKPRLHPVVFRGNNEMYSFWEYVMVFRAVGTSSRLTNRNGGMALAA
jgi:hypothetical protein